MNFTEAIGSAWHKKFDYASRSSRSEYWWFQLFSGLVTMGTATFAGIFSGPNAKANLLGSLIYLVTVVFAFLLGLPLSVRRLHDTNKSGWFLLLVFVPFLGGILIFVFDVLPSDPGPNTYGE